MKKFLRTFIRIVLGLVGLLLLVIVGLSIYATLWENQMRAELAKGSTLVQTGRGVMEYAAAGDGPAILALHGAPGGYDGSGGPSWVALGFRYISPSRPGYLRTPLSTGRTFEEQADALAALLDALGEDKAVIIGSSGGGPAALQFALRYPERCQALVLISAITQRRPMSDPDRMAIEFESTPLVSWLFTMVIIHKPEWVFAGFDPALEPNGDPEQYTPYINIALGALPLGPRHDGWRNDFELMDQMPTYPLEQITCPTLIVHGAEDANAPLAGAEFAATTIPNATFLKIEGSHLATLTQEDEVTPQIERFVVEHGLEP